MASFLSFINNAASILSGLALNHGCTFTISCAGSSVIFPVTPGNFKVGNTYNNSTVNINALGDINMLGKRGLMTCSFSGMFPAQNYPFSKMATSTPYGYIKKLKNFAVKGQPCRLYISGTDVNTPVTVNELSYGEKDGTGDVYFDITLCEYRYILPTSSQLDDTTGLASRVAEPLEEKNITYIPSMDIMDVAAETVGQLFPIAGQGSKQASLYKTLIKNNLQKGASFKATKSGLQLNGKSIKL